MEKQNPRLKEGGLKRNWDAGQIYIGKCYRAARTYRPAYLTSQDERNLQISVSTLDLHPDSNNPDDGPRFINPASHDAMEEFLEQNKPWETYDLEPVRQEECPQETADKPWVRGHRFHTGNFMIQTMQHFAQHQPGQCSYFNNDIDPLAG